MKIRTAASLARSAGITLTEILISIMILGIGLVSLATLFPIGLLRLREARARRGRPTSSESAAADMAARGLLNSELVHLRRPAQRALTFTPVLVSTLQLDIRGRLQPADPGHGLLRRRPATAGQPRSPGPGPTAAVSGGYGLPFAYDPLWRYQTVIRHRHRTISTRQPRPRPRPASAPASGSTPAGTVDGLPASAHGLQRLTNFNRPGRHRHARPRTAGAQHLRLAGGRGLAGGHQPELHGRPS